MQFLLFYTRLVKLMRLPHHGLHNLDRSLHLIVDYTEFHGKRMPNNQRLPKIAAYLSLFHHEDGFSFDIKF